MAGKQSKPRGQSMPSDKPRTRGRRRSPPRRKAARTARSPIAYEASCLLMIALGVLSFVFVYFESAGGFIGVATRGALIGVIGFGAFVLPYMLMAAGAVGLISREGVPRLKTLLAAALFLCVITLMAIPSVGVESYFPSMSDYIRHYYNAGSVANGGLIGAGIANVFLVSLGTFGSYVLIVTLGIILAIFLTGKSIMSIITALSERYASDDYYDEHDGEPEKPRGLERLTLTSGPFSKAKVKRKAPFFTIGESQRRDDEGVKLIGEEAAAAQEQTLTILRDEETGKIVDLMDMGADNQNPEEDDTPPFDMPDAKRPQETEKYVSNARVPDDEIIIKENTNKFIDITGGQEPEGTAQEAGAQQTAHIPMDSAGDEEEYIFPSISMLKSNPNAQTSGSRSSILENSRKLEDTLKSFGVEAKVVEVSKGPTVTRYELSPGVGVKVSRISSLADDLALNLAAVGIRIEAPIPGKAAVGIEIPNKEISPVYLREVIEDEAFKNFPSKLAFALGKDIAGNTVVADIAKMPHLLIAGATGSGKSVCINTLITSIIYKARPKEVKLLMVDPKVVELSIYNGIPHLLIPVVTDPKKAAGALFWAVQEMVRRYNLFAETAVRDLKGYNAMLAEDDEEPLPQIVIIIDELADLMMVAPGEVEDSICRLAQMARAAGLHLIIATQRPSVDVITGLIKANVPSRLAFAVSSGTDSRTILDSVGAERLLGKGDMLFSPVGLGKPQRIQGAFISDKEVESIVNFIKRGEKISYDDDMIERITAARPSADSALDGDTDELFDAAAEFLISKEKASASLLQRQFRIGYNRASRLIEDLEAKGIVGPEDGAKPRKVLMNAFQWREWLDGRAD